MVRGYAYIIQKSPFILAPGFSHIHTPIQYNNMYAHERQLHGFYGLCPSASASINVLSCSQQFPTLFVGDVGSLPFHSRAAIPPPFRSQDQSPAVLLCPACFLAVAWAITFKTLRLVTLTGIIYDVPLNRYSREDFFFLFLLVSLTDVPASLLRLQQLQWQKEQKQIITEYLVFIPNEMLLQELQGLTWSCFFSC